MTGNTTGPVLWEIDARGVASVTLNRPEVNNAYDGELIEGMLAALDALGASRGLRAVVSRGTGSISRPAPTSPGSTPSRELARGERPRLARDRRGDAAAQRAPVPTVALVQGACFGGGTGIIAACDVVIAADNAHVLDRRGALGADRGDHHPAPHRRHRRPAAPPLRAHRRAVRRRGGAAHRARPCGRPAGRPRQEGARSSTICSKTAPRRSRETKALEPARGLGRSRRRGLRRLVESHAAKRQSAEAAEGLASFAEKRPARWHRS